jgi:hypothetical protein
LSSTSAFGATGSGTWSAAGMFGNAGGRFLTSSTRGQAR